MVQNKEGRSVTKKDVLDTTSAVFAEFLGTLLFAWLGGIAKAAAFGNGLALSAMVFFTASTSGGHLNPAVTIALMATREHHWLKGILYIVAQLVGGIMGALLDGGLSGVTLGSGDGPACANITLTSDGVVFGYEFMMTFVLVGVIFATAVNKAGEFGGATPIAIGLALFVCADAGGDATGGYLNPARMLGPAIAFGCNLSRSWVYVLAEVLGGLASAIIYKTMMMKMKFFIPSSQYEDRQHGTDEVGANTPTMHEFDSLVVRRETIRHKSSGKVDVSQ
uniref:Aquaporin n=1 Tax=Palpitomonas bilix TaxID=652834 RepID=A0A7S3CWG4_9EUKA